MQKTTFVLALLAAVSVQASAQLPIDPRLVSTISARRPGEKLLIDTKGSHIGRLVRTTSDSVLLDEGDGTRQIAMQDIREISRSGNLWKKGATIGGITGGIIGAALGLAAITTYCNGQCHESSDYLLVSAYGAAIVGVPSALLGAGVGALSQGWHSIYRKE